MKTIRPRTYDLRSLKLSAEEGFVLSRVEAPVTLSELAALSGIEEARLGEIVARLAAQGALEAPGVVTNAPAIGAPPASARPAAPPEEAPPASARRPPPVPKSPPASSRRPPPVPKSPPASARPAAPPVPKSPPASAAAPDAPPPPPPQAAPLPVTALDLAGLDVPALDLGALDARPPSAPLRAVPTFAPVDELEDLGEQPPQEFAGIDELDELAPPEPTLERTVAGVSLAVAGVCDVGRARSNNEDALVVVDLSNLGVVDVLASRQSLGAGGRGVLLAVSDGMGGENAGEVASAMVLDTLSSHLTERLVEADPAGSLAAAVVEANARVIAAAEERDLSGMGATLVAVFVRGPTAFTAEVGDSRIYLHRRGKLAQLSKDQTHVRFLIEQGLMTPEDVKKSRAKNIILQACGKQPELVVAQRTIGLRLGDRLLLCSDGLTLHVDDAEIESVLAAEKSPDEASAKLVATVNERGGKDNVTVLIADVGGMLPWPGANETLDDTVAPLREFSPGEGGAP